MKQHHANRAPTSCRRMLALAGLVASAGLLPACNALTALPGTPSLGDAGGGTNPETTEMLAVFEDPDSDFSTSDVRDVDDEIVRFDATAKTLIWAADGSAFEGWEINGNFLGSSQTFQVRFGTVDGERHAYFTESGPGTICDIRIEDGMLRISATSVLVPDE